MTDSNLLFCDIETFSETPIRNGTFAYAEDAEVMILSWAFGYDTPAEVHDLTVDPRIPNILRLAVADPSITIVGQNFGNFDRNVLRLGRLPDGAPADFHIPVERIHDTMVQALSHGLPGSLDKLGEIFDIREEDAKIKEGRDLIQLFCKPRPKNQALRRATRHTHPAEWKRFLEYAKSDITAMRHIYRHMPRWNYPGESAGNRQAQEYRLWCLDQKINDRGILMDTELARHAIDAVNKAQKNLNDKVDDMTFGEVERASQRDRLLKHLLSYYDVDLPDMSKATLEKRVADPDLPEPVRELIAIRLESAQTANSKYNALLKGVSDDDRLRGTLQFCGAARTGRWCLAEGTQITVMRGDGVMDVPIEAVLLSDLVWDGDAWVAHEGVVYSGDKTTIEHDGVVATAEHIVYLSSSQSAPLGEVKEKGLPIWRGNSSPFTG